MSLLDASDKPPFLEERPADGNLNGKDGLGGLKKLTRSLVVGGLALMATSTEVKAATVAIPGNTQILAIGNTSTTPSVTSKTITYILPSGHEGGSATLPYFFSIFSIGTSGIIDCDARIFFRIDEGPTIEIGNHNAVARPQPGVPVALSGSANPSIIIPKEANEVIVTGTMITGGSAGSVAGYSNSTIWEGGRNGEELKLFFTENSIPEPGSLIPLVAAAGLLRRRREEDKTEKKPSIKE